MQLVTSEFAYEYQKELTALFRRRLIWYLWTMLGLTLILAGLVLGLKAIFPGRASFPADLYATLIAVAPATLLYSAALWKTTRTPASHAQLLRAAWIVIALEAFLTIFFCNIAIELGVTRLTTPGLGGILLAHTIACSFLPWTARQCIYAFIPQFWVWAVALVLFQGGFAALLPGIFLAPLVGVPGLGICIWRMTSFHRSFDHRMVRQAFGSLKRELIDARRVHEGLFPEPLTDGPLRLWYSYQPMRQIGGDYLHVHRDEQDRLHMALIDVTGHGIAAALTVNRLAGEIERLHAEGLATADINQDGQLDPGELLAALNRYIWLTLSHHSVYATALCARLTPAQGNEPATITWASGGHPPAYLRRADGGIEEFASTSYMLGAVPPDHFDSADLSVELRSGDCLIAYTDGAFENRDRSGQTFGLRRLREAVALSPRTPVEAADFLRQTIDAFRYGPNDDDILIVAVGYEGAVAAHPTEVREAPVVSATSPE
jgi:serine phosphatase RsbU (regulator of sigma subunit)